MGNWAILMTKPVCQEIAPFFNVWGLFQHAKVQSKKFKVKAFQHLKVKSSK
jgi:hypothetical protein